MRIDHPTDAEISGLRQLWKEAFGDTDGFLDAFFSTGFSPERCLYAGEGGTVAAAAAVLAEGDAAERTDILFLEKLPLFDKTGKPLC